MVNDQLIFSFKYNKYKLLWRTVVYFIIPPIMMYKIVFVWSVNSNKPFYILFFSKFFGSLFLFMIISNILLTLSTQEVLLYKNKIVKKMCFGIKKYILFENCKIDGMKTPFFSTKKFFCLNTPVLFSPIFGVFYDENLADSDDIKKMNLYLSELSGRSCEEFEKNIVKIPNFYKER